MVEPSEDQLVEFKILLDGNHLPAVAARKEYDSSHDLRRFYSAILNVLNKKPKNFNQQQRQRTTGTAASTTTASSNSTAPTLFGSGPPGMPAPVSQGASGNSKPGTRSAAVAPGMSDGRDSFYANSLNGVGYDDNALDDIAQFGAFEPLGVSSFGDSLGLDLGALSIGGGGDDNSNSIDNDYHFMAHSYNGPSDTTSSTVRNDRVLPEMKQKESSQAESFFGSDENGDPIGLDLGWDKSSKHTSNSSSGPQNIDREKSNAYSRQNQPQQQQQYQQHQYGYPPHPYGYGYGHPLGNSAGMNNPGIPYPYPMPYSYPYHVAPPMHNSQYGQLEGYPSAYGPHGAYNPYVGYGVGLSSNDGQSNISHNPYGVSQTNPYPGMPPPLPSEFYGAHMGQGQFFNDSGSREQQQHQVHVQHMNGVNEQNSGQGVGFSKSSTFERTLEQNRSKTNSPVLPASTASVATTQLMMEATAKTKKEKKSKVEKKSHQDDGVNNAENINKQIEQNDAKKKEKKKEKNGKKEKLHENGNVDSHSKNSKKGQKEIDVQVDHYDGDVIMFGEIPVEISVSPSGNAGRVNTDAAFEEKTTARTKKVKLNKAAVGTLPATKKEETGVKRVQVSNPHSKQLCEDSISNAPAQGSEVKRKAILSMLKK